MEDEALKLKVVQPEDEIAVGEVVKVAQTKLIKQVEVVSTDDEEN